ncbi:MULTISPECIES: alpha-amylase family glycosyl hydrolase [unclassified Variovorax]|uniref:alpha-amylase family glycosyl hydrolase n=1 Tax=unclassified Variovorax TaxID=663243 RepID=UPI0008C8DCA0|nr:MULTISPECIES: alpha-amylase family glycosyl hydrolase [unclassified Variovorax]SEK17412.1 alpha-glucosidase [Variovorax sp. OK202]SFE40681.1 alpha-glucosidase [Variovorax sp. OK212]
MDTRQQQPAPPDGWWKNGIVYQIYPRSFQDSDGDGIGDLRGIRQRLDYLVSLGVDAVWISPIYPSPMADFGYDISDYCGIDARFGTLADFDELVRSAHARGLKVILDFVPNHTSERHPWFTQSRSSRQDPKRDWYLWRDPAPGGGPPNNWLSNFGGPAWTLDSRTGQYYLHSFLREQPDLNWRNPEVRAAMYEALRFWLRRGVDGFRIDVLYHLVKDAAFRDNPANPAFVPGGDPSHSLLPLYTADLPEVQEIVREMRGVVDAFSDAQGDRVLIGELYLPLARLVAYYGLDSQGVLQGVQLPFNFQLIGAPWQAGVIERLVRDYEAALPPGAAPNWVLGNHDKPRIASRVGSLHARLAAMLLLTLRGTPTLYYGDEIGMTDAVIPPGEVQDPFEKNEPGKGLGRDPQRTPMQWSAAPHAGFSQGKPWLRLGDDWATRNVERQQGDATSMLALYRRLIALRRAEPALHAGAWAPLDLGADILAYARTLGQRRLMVLLNFADAQRDIGSAVSGGVVGVLASTHEGREGLQAEPLSLAALEGVVLAVQGPASA